AQQERAEESERYGDVRNVKRNLVRVERRREEQVVLEPETAGNDHTGAKQQRRRLLNVSAEAEQERDNEAHGEHHPGNVVPGLLAQTEDNVLRLFRHVSVPNRQIVAPEQVGPEDAEAKEQLAEIVQRAALYFESKQWMRGADEADPHRVPGHGEVHRAH